MEAKVVVSSCGHDGPMGATVVKRLRSVGMIESVPGMKALDMNTAEDAIVKLTREIVPGMIVTGMEVAEIDGISQNGANFWCYDDLGTEGRSFGLEGIGTPKCIGWNIGGSLHPELILAAPKCSKYLRASSGFGF
ncbi:thiamine thiazole synthase, chloroplastic [Artemisia annua]|uniref:Thiamine thiazole synthase, chloroplastic n=1 Tax=Artemisia annua TaxID=35608 RepID=A0A2U1PF74_ARTAN|nr:thiamine thiazole synthase, chloroplastic [Artemisia annua]